MIVVILTIVILILISLVISNTNDKGPRLARQDGVLHAQGRPAFELFNNTRLCTTIYNNMYVYVYIYIYMYTYICICICVYVYTYIYIYTHSCTCYEL